MGLNRCMIWSGGRERVTWVMPTLHLSLTATGSIDRLVYGEQVCVRAWCPRLALSLTHTSTLSYCFVVCKEKKCTVTFTSRCSWWLASPMWRQEQFLFILIISIFGFAGLFFPCSSKVIYVPRGSLLVRFGCGLPKVSCTRIHHAAYGLDDWPLWFFCFPLTLLFFAVALLFLICIF